MYIFSANAGLRQPVRSAAGDFRGSLKFARYDQNTSLMPCSPCMRGNIFTGMTEEARGGKATFVPLSQGSTSTLTCSPRSSLKKSFTGIIGFLIRYEVSSPFTRCARMLWQFLSKNTQLSLQSDKQSMLALSLPLRSDTNKGGPRRSCSAITAPASLSVPRGPLPV